MSDESSQATGHHLIACDFPGDNPRAPIPTLFPELLLKIFLLNAEMDNDDPDYSKFAASQITTRHASCVCQLWREVALGSSLLWANLIHVRQGSAEWRGELLRRSKNSPLCVRGKIKGDDILIERHTFMMDLLMTHWSRIRTLDVTFKRPYLFRQEMWAVFQRPAPLLQSFTVLIRKEIVVTETVGLHPPLFGDNAPSLREFICRSISLDIGSRCLSNVRRLNITGKKRDRTLPTLSKMLQVLAGLPFLEELFLAYAFLTTSAPLSPVDLPRLHELSLDQDFDGCSAFLDHVYPQDGCSLMIRVPVNNVPENRVTRMHRALSRLTRSWFQKNKNTARHLGLSITNRAFCVWYNGSPVRHEDIDCPFFDVQIDCENARELAIVLPLLGAFSGCHLNTITSFTFEIALFTSQNSDSNIRQFLLSLSSVQVLVASLDALDVLLPLPENQSQTDVEYLSLPVFPLLHTLKLTKNATHSTRPVEPPLLPFLTWRANAHAPLKTLDLREQPAADLLIELAKFPGLDVLCRPYIIA
ncbi:hypothetical protein B0H34DRAFT_179737 [Crassisporium funariophilum]|nr:hypothetical protein B0H34DRAFT_179737 [Crassisporium funariophilum]